MISYDAVEVDYEGFVALVKIVVFEHLYVFPEGLSACIDTFSGQIDATVILKRFDKYDITYIY